MEQLGKAYEAIETLKELGLPVSRELLVALSQMEQDYLKDEIIPLIEQEFLPLVEKLRNSFELDFRYSKECGLNISLRETPGTKAKAVSIEPTSRRQRQFIIRVVFPDNRVSCHHAVWQTLVDVVKYAGPENVQRLGLVILGDNLVSSILHENERYRIGQKEVGDGLYVCTYSDTEVKYNQIKTINKELNLGLTIEKQMLG